ncbi:MAG: hypothetical protein J6W00_01905 [Lentisphaeria bacterium]|nr:hypothetical protein [Lentisphaeria bacterium]
MAEFNTKCPNCNAVLQVQDEWVGMEVECPECQKKFTIAPNISVKKFVSIQGNLLKNKLKSCINAIKEPADSPEESNADTQIQNDDDNKNFFRDKLNLYVNAMGAATILFVFTFPCCFYWTWGEKLHGWGGLENLLNILLNSGATLSLSAYTVTLALEAYLLYEFINSIPRKRQRQNPVASALLMLLPFWCYLWNFFTLPRIAADLKKEITMNGKKVPKNLYGNALGHCIFSVFILFFAVLLCSNNISGSPAAIIGSILFTLIIVFSAIAVQFKTYMGLAAAAALIKKENNINK